MMTAKSTDELIGLLRDFRTRAPAHRALNNRGLQAADELMRILDDADAPGNMKWAAIDILAGCSYEPAIPKLVDILDSEPNLVGEAADALRAITGRDLGESAAEWRSALYGTHDSEGVAADDSTPPLSSDAERLAFVRDSLAAEVHEVAWEDGGYAYIRVPLGERSHQVLALFEDTEDGEAHVTLYTECGAPTQQAADTLDRRNAELENGEFTIDIKEDEGGKAVVMRDAIARHELTNATFRTRVLAMARVADALEEEMHGADVI